MKKIIEKMALAGGALFLLLALMLSARLVVLAVYDNNTATGLTNLRVKNVKILDIGIYDSGGTLRFTPGSTNAIAGNLTVSGALAPQGFTVLNSTAPRDVSSSIAITPTAIGQLVYNSTDKELCVSTAAVIRSWIEVSTTAVVACRH